MDKRNTIALLFPGQGGQYPGMGKELYDQFDVVKDIFRRAKHTTGIAIDELCFQGPEEKLKETLFSQLCVLAVSIASFEVLRTHLPGFSFAYAAGLSLGEYSALYAAGVLGLEETFLLVKNRAEHMQKACKERSGTMVSLLGVEEAAAEELCRKMDGFCKVANLNCPGQVVVSCEKALVPEVIDKAKQKGAKRSIEIQVAGAFHSDYMSSAAEAFEDNLKDIPFQEEKACRVIFNLTGEAFDPDKDDVRQILKDHVTHPVLWEKSVRTMLKKGVSHFIEPGPGKILGGLLKRIDRTVSYYHIEDRQSLEKTLEALSGSLVF
ncbi:MAG: ACP S-malonyltransferase [Candidatus Aureabacteria bacterium]|nr:ACP S-malonyltransferase [Candidatus Auribacterota bacterium]